MFNFFIGVLSGTILTALVALALYRADLIRLGLAEAQRDLARKEMGHLSRIIFRQRCTIRQLKAGQPTISRGRNYENQIDAH